MVIIDFFRLQEEIDMMNLQNELKGYLSEVG